MKRFALVALFLLTLVAPAVALVPSSLEGQQQPPKAAQDEFVPVTGPIPAQDTIPSPRLVGIAYGFIWVVLFGYVWSIKGRLSRVEREMEAVSRRVTTRQ